jgi:CubicO group peptidase (beta-lactamase class C family)
MNLKNLILLTIVLLTSKPCFGQQSNIAQHLDSLFSFLSEQNQFNGSVLIAEKGEVIYKGGKGYSNESTKEKNNPETIFEIASCSKQFIGVSIALLHREGKIDYTDDITKYIPELPNFKGVTIYNLLRHTSGIPDYLGQFRIDWKNDRIATNQDVIEYHSLKKDTLEFLPNSTHYYSNTNYVFLATIIERISKQKIADYLSERIFKPLKMNRTFVYNRRLEPREIKNYAYGYSWIKNSFERVTLDDDRIGSKIHFYMDGIVGDAKVNSTVEDIYKWKCAIKNNALLSMEEYNKVMEISQTTDKKDVRYGFGFDVRKRENSISYGHTGSWDGYISLIHYNSKNDRTIIILNNFMFGACPYQTITEILDNKESSNEFSKKINLKDSEIKKYEGEYADTEDSTVKHVITYLDNHLIYNTNKANWDMRFFPTSTNTFKGIRIGGTDGVLKFLEQDTGVMKLEMMQNGEIIGNAIRK